ncbi:MAG: PilZ domain-containing protein [Betaproteobacteria bacterium]|nr:PilZ domain-containing protein [Betaproteobacteria bacterium]
MSEQRRHQRIRFSVPPLIRLGQRGQRGQGELENLSLSGLMFRTPLVLNVGETFGCEFSVFGSPLIDMPALAVSHVGNLYGARFQAGPISELLIRDAIAGAIACGKASILSIHDLDGRRVMRVSGGLNHCLRSDFMHGLSKVGVVGLDLSGVTDIDSVGLALCLLAAEQYRVAFDKHSPCFDAAWAGAGRNSPDIAVP